MPAPKGNTFAKKWTPEKVIDTLNKMWDKLLEDESKEYVYIGQLLIEFDLYKQVWSYWKETFKGELEVLEPIKKIEEEFESRLYVGALNGRYVASVAIFSLKNNHGWKDRADEPKKHEHSGKVEFVSKVIVEEKEYEIDDES